MSYKLFWFLSFLLLLALIYAGLQTGSFEIHGEAIFNSFASYDPQNTFHYVIVNLRLPRLVLAFLAGGALALSGYLMQAMVNNPLADPYILGTASGASLGASIIYMVLPISAFTIFYPSMAAFLGAMGVTLIAVLIGNSKGRIIPAKLLLTGIALSSLTVAIISFLIFFSNDESKLKTIIFWSMGSFEGARWEYIPLLLIALFAAVLLFTFYTKHLTLLLLGENRAENLGLKVSSLRWAILIISSLITGFSVATCGPIGFVGLMVPHFTRGLFGVTGKYNILNTTILGGNFMLACDVFSRYIYPPAGIPIGIITAFLGIPFFVYLLSRNNLKFN